MKKFACISVLAAFLAAPALALDLEIPKGVGQEAGPKGPADAAPPAPEKKAEQPAPPAATAPVTPPASTEKSESGKPAETPPKGDFALTSPAGEKPDVVADYEVMGAPCDPKTGGDGSGGFTVRMNTTGEVQCKGLGVTK